MAVFVRPSASWLPPRIILAIVGAVVFSSAPSRAQAEDLVNPFGREETAAPVPVAGDADLDALQFSGLVSIVDQRSFNFTDTRTRKNFWVPMNGTENGFTVVSYDANAEQVVVRRGTRTRPIALRKTVLVALPAGAGARPAGPTGPVPVTTAAAPRPPGSGVDEIKNPKTPAEIKQAEFEARMLVSDLLDISMQERARQKALRDAQARGQTGPSPAPPAAR